MSGYAQGIKVYWNNTGHKPSEWTLQQHTWTYNAGFLQGVSGAELKTSYTQEFMSGYTKGIGLYWFNRGGVEGNNKLPMSSHNANYTKGIMTPLTTCPTLATSVRFLHIQATTTGTFT
jgi:hypothetical protein